jgi:DNA-binding CsgD family transcriptional regulator
MIELSPRHKEVLIHAAHGLECKESARLAGLSPETIKDHRKAAMDRIGATNITQAVAIAIRTGVIK